MTRPMPACANDASAPQLLATRRFPWSRNCKSDILRQYASILVHANHNQWAWTIKTPRPSCTSRRLQWRNSHWLRPSLCRSPRHFASRSSPNPNRHFSLHPRPSMSSRGQPRASTKVFPGQGPGLAPPIRRRFSKQKPVSMAALQAARRLSAHAHNLLWPWRASSVTLRNWREGFLRAIRLSGLVLASAPTLNRNRRDECRNTRSSPLSELRSCSRPAPVRRPSQSPSPCLNRPPLWKITAPARACDVTAGPALGPDLCTGSAGRLQGGLSC